MKLYQYIGGKTENSVEKEIKSLTCKYRNLLNNKYIMDSEVVQLSKNLDELLIHYIKVSVNL